MPYCPLSVSCKLSKKQIKDLTYQITDALVQIAKKPSTAVMINVMQNCNLFLNKDSDAAYLEINAVALSDAIMEELGIRFLDIIAEITGINYDSIFVHFDISNRASWVLCGHTLEYWHQKNMGTEI